MEESLLDWLASDNGFVVHSAVLILLVLGGFGFPMPEDIPILLAGVAISKEIVSANAMFLTCYGGIIISDQIVYFLGYFFGKRLVNAGTRSSFLPSVTEERVNELREGLRKKRLMMIFLGRHLFPLRTVTFLTAGTLRIPFVEFLISDALAALVSVVIVLSIGYFLGEKLTPEVMDHMLGQAHVYILGISVIIILVYVFKKYIDCKKKKAQT